MRIIVLGGDGFCGWPTALHLNEHHDVLIVDNLSRRSIGERTGESLTPIEPLSVRVAGTGIEFSPIDIAFADPGILQALFREWKPDAVVHFAEQRSAPYSMKSPETRRYTIANNIGGTSNVLNAIVEVNKDIHLVHLGTMGVYGYGGPPIPDGYVETEYGKHLYPPRPGSVYHTTKVMDAEMFQFYNRNWGLKITDLHQGIVWGTQTAETDAEKRWINRFDYDGDYGTVLNRFLVQAAVGHPLTVYGTGGQTRAFIHISDTVKCIRLALESPPPGDEVRILNQQAECRSVLELAEIVRDMTGERIDFLENPRKEASENDLEVTNAGFRGLGWEPVLLRDSLIHEIIDIAGRWHHRVNKALIPPSSQW